MLRDQYCTDLKLQSISDESRGIYWQEYQFFSNKVRK